MKKIIFVLVGFFISGISFADTKTETSKKTEEKPVEMKGTVIRGTTELPKVMYIVPWKKSQVSDILPQTGKSMFGDELEPLDRDIFRRQVEYYEMLHNK